MTTPNSFTDDDIITQAVADASNYDAIISHAVARMIASQWHSGQRSALYSFASCGAIAGPALESAITNEMNAADKESDIEALRALWSYVQVHGPKRGPVAGWSSLWGR